MAESGRPVMAGVPKRMSDDLSFGEFLSVVGIGVLTVVLMAHGLLGSSAVSVAVHLALIAIAGSLITGLISGLIRRTRRRRNKACAA